MKIEIRPKVIDSIKGMPRFITGSSLVKGITPNDIDIVVLVPSWDSLNKIIETGNFTDIETSLDKDPRFMSVRDGKINYIFTPEEEMFYRFKAFSGALKHLQIKEKDERVDLSIACLYWNGIA